MKSATHVSQRAMDTSAGEHFDLFVALKRRGVRGMSVTRSVKLSAGALEAGRYSVRFDATADNMEAAAQTCRQLRLPHQAEAWIQTQMGGWSSLGPLASARVQGRTFYRAYFRTGEEKTGAFYGRAVEWSASGAAESGYKHYRLLDVHTPAAIDESLRGRLQLRDDLERSAYAGWLDILRMGGERVQLLEVTESQGARLSYDAAPAFPEPVTMQQISPLWRRACAAFGADDVLASTIVNSLSGGALENTTFGRDSRGGLFMALYFGAYHEPFALDTSRASTPATPSGLIPSDAKSSAGSLVFVLGQVRVAAADERRRLREALPANGLFLRASSLGAASLSSLLDAHPEASSELDWTIEVGGKPTYVLQIGDDGADYAGDSLRSLVRSMSGPISSNAASDPVLVAVGGRLTGDTRTVDGILLPVLIPSPSAMFSWTPRTLLRSAQGPIPASLGSTLNLFHELSKQAGQRPTDRAMNFLATQPAALAPVLGSAEERGVALNSISTGAHNINLFGLDRIDVTLHFKPIRQRSTASLDAIFTVDVSTASPFMTGRASLMERL